MNQVVARIQDMTGQNIKENIVVSKSYAHEEFTLDFNSYKGNAYGLANTLFKLHSSNPKYRNRKVKNLYYTGQLTVPGPGMPPALVSGKIVAEQILKDYN